jgi:hypothetical protein
MRNKQIFGGIMPKGKCGNRGKRIGDSWWEGGFLHVVGIEPGTFLNGKLVIAVKPSPRNECRQAERIGPDPDQTYRLGFLGGAHGMVIKQVI